MTEPFDPACAQTWIGRGRAPEHAAIIAEAWRNFPDLPPDFPLEERMARTRERVAAMRPVHEAMRLAQESARQARNFTFTENRVARGEGDERDRAILAGRDRHGFDWDACIEYAYGWYAAYAGWPASPPRETRREDLPARYMTGFRDGGGDPDDLFDAARRSIAAADREDRRPAAGASAPVARPLPSSWPLPSDAPRPTIWSKRLLILGAPEADCAAHAEVSAPLAPILADYPGAEAMTIVVVAADGFAPAVELSLANPAREIVPSISPFIAGREFDDILIAAQGTFLDRVDAQASFLPLARNMERTRNTPLQQKSHFRIWLDRGIGPGEIAGAGHIRWGKVAKGLTAKLGEFTARYMGKDPQRGHRILVELADGEQATGFVTPRGEHLDPESYISNRKNLRAAMTSCLRRFGGATRLAPISPLPDLDPSSSRISPARPSHAADRKGRGAEWMGPGSLQASSPDLPFQGVLHVP